MKKVSYIILALSIIFTLTACGGGDETETTEVARTEGNGIVSDHTHCVCVGKAVNAGEHKACFNDDGWVEVGTARELTDELQ